MKYFCFSIFCVITGIINAQNLITLRIDSVNIKYLDSSEVIDTSSSFIFLPKKDTLVSIFHTSFIDVIFDMKKDTRNLRSSKFPVEGFVLVPNHVKIINESGSFIYRSQDIRFFTDRNDQANCSLTVYPSINDSSQIKHIKIHYQFIAGAPELPKTYSLIIQNGTWYYYKPNGNLYKTCNFKNDVKDGKETFFTNGRKTWEKEYENGELLTYIFFKRKDSKQIDFYEKNKLVKTTLYNNKGIIRRTILY